MFLKLGKEDIKVSIKDSGTVLRYAGLIFFVPIAFAILMDRNPWNLIYYAFSALLIFAAGSAMTFFVEPKKETEIKHALLSTVFIWLLFCFFASLPFYFISEISPIDSYFETMSALTTTGLSVITPLVDNMPPSLIFWRTFLSWIGGIGIIVISLVGLMTTYSKTSKLMSAEGRGEALGGNIKSTGKKIFGIYVGLTLIGIIFLFFSGQTLWEATNYSMSAISTTGTSITSEGLTGINNGWEPIGVNNYWVQLSLILIMILGATSFSLHYLFLKTKNIKLILQDSQFKTLLLLGLLGTIIVSMKLEIMESLFHIFSALTCGGMSIINQNIISNWDDFVKTIFIFLFIIGGSAGSTAGGIKISRALIFTKSIYWRIKQSVLPQNAFFKRAYEGEPVNETELKELSQFILLWIILLAIGTIIVSFYGYSLSDSLFEVASAQSNAGLSSGITNMGMPFAIKLMLIINMFVGRLEIIPILASIGFILGLRKGKQN
jgi:trk system potassium uptake protein